MAAGDLAAVRERLAPYRELAHTNAIDERRIAAWSRNPETGRSPAV
jgi:hypothetical protein